MRIATLIIGLILMFVIGIQGCLVGAGGAFLGDEQLSGGGGMGFLAALLAGIAAAFSLAKPLVSMIIFIIGAIVSFIAASSGFSDMNVWGVLLLILALFSYFGHRELKNKNPQSTN